MSSVFAAAGAYSFANRTLMDVLALKSGNGVNGAAATLVRAGVSALLSAAHPAIDYPLTTAQVLVDVNSALASGDRTTMLELAKLLGLFNGLDCPID